MSYRLFSVKEISKLSKKSVRDELGVFVIEGKKIIEEAVRSKAEIQQLIVTDKFSREQKDFLEQLHLDSRTIVTISDHHAHQLTTAQAPAGVFAVLNKFHTELPHITSSDFIVVLENIRDPGNLGTIIRTADWFGIKSLIMSAEGVDVYNDKVLRSAMGSIFHLNLYITRNIVSTLQEVKGAGFSIVVTQPEARAQQIPKTTTKLCVVMGNESLGTSAEVDALADFAYAIPRRGQAESLNVAVSCGIILYDLMLNSGSR